MGININKYIPLSTHVSYISTSTNIGIIAFPCGKTVKIYLIDSGNDDAQAQDILKLLSKHYESYTIEAVLNTHSHADHCGGNIYLREKTGCKIWSSKGEAALMAHPEIETGLIWGGTPVHEIRSDYLMAKACDADRIFKGEEEFTITEDGTSIRISVVNLSGHYLDQTGFIVTDTDGKKSFFMGDAISGRNVIRRYWIQYLLDEPRTKESLLKIAETQADFYIPGHGQSVKEIEGLAELNLIAIIETEDMIVDELSCPKTTEEILKSVADRSSITLHLANYVLIGSTLKSYLSGLYEAGKITYFIEGNRLLWKKI